MSSQNSSWKKNDLRGFLLRADHLLKCLRHRGYDLFMMCVLSCVLLLAPSLTGYSVRLDRLPQPSQYQVKRTPPEQELNSTLAALKQGRTPQSDLSQQLAHVMMRLAEDDHRPPWPLLVSFTDKLTPEVIGRQLSNAQVTIIGECIVEGMHRTGNSNAELASRLQQTLIGLGIESSKTQAIIGDFIRIREAVQGPDDAPLRR